MNRKKTKEALCEQLKRIDEIISEVIEYHQRVIKETGVESSYRKGCMDTATELKSAIAQLNEKEKVIRNYERQN